MKAGKITVFHKKIKCDHITTTHGDGGTQLVNKFLAWKKANG
jgi:hypothetical protein